MVLVPSRSESFGLVALEAAACGIPVVASAVGGLLALVDDGATGFLIRERDPAEFAERDRPRSSTTRCWRRRCRSPPAARAKRYTWSFAAARLRRLYTDLTVAPAGRLLT